MGFVLYAVLPGGTRVALAEVPGGTLPLVSVPKFQTPLLIPPVMPKAGTIVARGGKNVDYYEISMRQISQQILPAGLPATTVWGYGAVAAASKRGLLLHNAPSLTIEATWDRPVRVKWINDLVDEHGDHLPHLLPVDPTLHWANPPGGEEGRDSRPSFDTTPGRVPRPRADGHTRARRRRRRRRERRLRRGLVPAGGRRHPRRLRDGGHLVRVLRGQGGGPVRRGVGPGLRDLPVPQRPARVDHLVPRPHARDDATERVRRTGGILPHPRWPRRRRRRARQSLRQDCRASRARHRRRTTRFLRTRRTTRSRSPCRTVRSTTTGRCSTPTPGSSSTASWATTSRSVTSRRSGIPSSSATRSSPTGTPGLSRSSRSGGIGSGS